MGVVGNKTAKSFTPSFFNGPSRGRATAGKPLEQTGKRTSSSFRHF